MKPLARRRTGAEAPNDSAPRMSLYDFMKSRMDDVIYARPIQDENGSAFAVYAADGTFLDLFDTLGEVIIAAHDHDMVVATVH